MPVKIKQGAHKDSIQNKVDELSKRIQEREKKKKRKILLEVAGSVIFDTEKTPLEIQQQMRNEWE